MSSFNRPNLRYSIISKKGKNCSDEVVAMIMAKFKNACGIVYCLSRKDCDDYAAHMKKNGIKALSYHAGLTDNQRSNCQGRWISDEVHLFYINILFFYPFFFNISCTFRVIIIYKIYTSKYIFRYV